MYFNKLKIVYLLQIILTTLIVLIAVGSVTNWLINPFFVLPVAAILGTATGLSLLEKYTTAEGVLTPEIAVGIWLITVLGFVVVCL